MMVLYEYENKINLILKFCFYCIYFGVFHTLKSIRIYTYPFIFVIIIIIIYLFYGIFYMIIFYHWVIILGFLGHTNPSPSIGYH